MFWLCLILPFLAAPARGDERRTLPGGEIILRGEVPPPDKDPAPRPLRTLAATRGVFKLRYRLARDGAGCRAENVDVSVRNTVRYHAPRSARVDDHETGHVRINQAAAREMTSVLGAFRAETPSLKTAEKIFRARFQSLVEETEAMHRAWDENHTIVSEEKKK